MKAILLDGACANGRRGEAGPDEGASGDLPWARWVLAVVISVHGALLLLMLGDYFADNDLGYHISLARQYAEHGSFWWDTLNWAPTGRPNLQGPALHYAVGLLGRVLGGEGWDYVHAFSVLAIGQWAAAVFTAVFFARRFGGDLAALLAGALLTGNVFSAASFFVGVPSGWIFILSAWSIHFFLQERYVRSALFGTLTAYVHLGGAPVIALGLILAGILTGRWRGLIWTGALTLALASPYVVHFLTHLDWYNGQRGQVAGSVALFTYVLAGPGIVWLLFQRKRGLFLLLWTVAPLPWLFQDGLRFFLQSTVAASVIAGVFITWALLRLDSVRARHALAGGLVLLATIFPFAIPSLLVEFIWASGRGFPRELDWTEAEALAVAVENAGLRDRIIDPYYISMAGAMSVFSPGRERGGHWGEVRPLTDPADTLSTGSLVYMLPLAQDDSLLVALVDAGLVVSHGGGRTSLIVTLPVPGEPEVINPLVVETISREGRWLVDNAVPNLFPDPSLIFHQGELESWKARMTVQKWRVGRIQLAVLLYAYSIEGEHPEVAVDVRRSARGWGGVANFIGDETAMDYVDAARFQRFRENLLAFVKAAQVLETQLLPSPELDQAANRLFDEFF
jgi:hypothetical protein